MSKANTKYTVAAFLMFCCIPPFFFWHIPVPAIAEGILFLVLITCFKNTEVTPLRIIMFLLYIVLAILDNGNIFSKILKLFICPLFFCDALSIKQIYDSFTKILCISLLLSIPIYILVVFFGLDLPHTTIDPLNTMRDEKYVLYPFLVQAPSNAFSINYRFLGMFDEPGVIGTFCGIILLLDRFDFKKRRNWVFAISGLFSMSLTFFFILAMGVLFYSPKKVKLIVILLIPLAVYLLYNNDVVYYYVFRRFEVNDGKFAGYNRTSMDFDLYFLSFLNSPNALWGLGAGTSAELDEGGASFKHMIVDYGLVFFVIYYFSFILDSIIRIKKWYKIAIYIICISCILYQRPFITNIVYVFLIFSPIVLLELDNEVNSRGAVNNTRIMDKNETKIHNR